MDTRNYWLDVYSGTTWEEFQKAGGEVTGFRERQRKTFQQIRPGDYFLCYLTGVSRWIGVLEVVEVPYKDQTPIWKDEDFPCRVKVKAVATLTPETAVPVLQLKNQLSIFKDLKHPHAWTGYFRRSPAKWQPTDGKMVVDAIFEAQKNPVVRDVNPAKLVRPPTALRAAIGSVTVPDSLSEQPEITKEPTPHTEIQWMLLKLGNDMGLDVWVARNDRGREVNGHKFTDLQRLKEDLPFQFDEATNRTIELIDVLWLNGNAIVAAFEIESTTSIYSGLLRMSDLISMQPNLKMPLYLVAPDERREKVIAEVNRPTFSRLPQPMNQICRFLSFSALREKVAPVASMIRHLKPEFLEELSESCEVEEV